MEKGRLEAFSDGVFAIIITIMVLELKVPHGAEWADLRPLLPVFLSYALSFVYVAIYWNNHHHTFQAAREISGGVLWANAHLLFWLSLTPFVTAWAGENHFESAPVALYGVALLMSGVAYYLLVICLTSNDPTSLLTTAIGTDLKGKTSIILYIVAIAFAFWLPLVSCAIYICVALMWFIPDRRIENKISSVHK